MELLDKHMSTTMFVEINKNTNTTFTFFEINEILRTKL
jgi:hypothetical protein